MYYVYTLAVVRARDSWTCLNGWNRRMGGILTIFYFIYNYIYIPPLHARNTLWVGAFSAPIGSLQATAHKGQKFFQYYLRRPI